MSLVKLRRCRSGLLSLRPNAASRPVSRRCADIRTEPRVDLERFMGDWYVIANIPTFVEKSAHCAIESYRLDDDGSIATTYSYRRGGFTAVEKKLCAKGFVIDTSSNAIWRMQFLWPFKGDYRIVYLNDDYSQVVIGRNRRDYAWIMARSAELSGDDLFERIRLLREEGYDTSKIRLVPQQPMKH